MFRHWIAVDVNVTFPTCHWNSWREMRFRVKHCSIPVRLLNKWCMVGSGAAILEGSLDSSPISSRLHPALSEQMQFCQLNPGYRPIALRASKFFQECKM